jgi:hypothetical protein
LSLAVCGQTTGIANQIGYPSSLSTSIVHFISFSDGVTFRTYQIAERGLQYCKLELVAEVEGFPGHDAPTVNDGLRFFPGAPPAGTYGMMNTAVFRTGRGTVTSFLGSGPVLPPISYFISIMLSLISW